MRGSRSTGAIRVVCLYSATTRRYTPCWPNILSRNIAFKHQPTEGLWMNGKSGLRTPTITGLTVWSVAPSLLADAECRTRNTENNPKTATTSRQTLRIAEINNMRFISHRRNYSTYSLPTGFRRAVTHSRSSRANSLSFFFGTATRSFSMVVPTKHETRRC